MADDSETDRILKLYANPTPSDTNSSSETDRILKLYDTTPADSESYVYIPPSTDKPQPASTDKSGSVLGAMGDAYYGTPPILPESVTDSLSQAHPYVGYVVNALSRAPGTVASLYRGAQQLGINAGLPGDVVSLPDAYAGSPHMLTMTPGGTSYLLNRGTFGKLGDVASTVSAPKPSDGPPLASNPPAVVGGGYLKGTPAAAQEAAQAARAPEPVAIPEPSPPAAGMQPEPSPAPVPTESTVGAQQTPANAAPAMDAGEAAARQARNERSQLEQVDNDRRVGGIDTHNPIPDYQHTLGTADLSHANEELYWRNKYPEFFKPVDTANNAALVQHLDSHIPDDIAIKNMEDARGAQADTDIAPLKSNPKPVDLQPVSDLIDRQLGEGAEDRGLVKNVLQNVKDTLTDADGNLRTDPLKIYNGARKNITDMLERSKADPASNEATAAQHLVEIKNALDTQIAGTNPSFRTYLDNYSAASRPIDEANIMNRVRQKVVSAEGVPQLKPLDTQLNSLFTARNISAGANEAKSISPETLDVLHDVRNMLQAQAARDNYGRVVGSNTASNFLQAQKYSAPKPSAGMSVFKNGLEVAAHGLSSAVDPTGIVGNAIVRYTGQKLGEGRAVKAAQAAQDAAAAQEAANQARAKMFLNSQIGHNGGPPLEPGFNQPPGPRSGGAAATPWDQVNDYTPTTDLAASYNHAPPVNASAPYRASYIEGGRNGVYDPNYFDKEPYDLKAEDGSVVASKDNLLPRSNLRGDVPIKADPNMLYRGMSHDEYQNFLNTGRIESNGSYNIGDGQKGLTYFSTDPQQAQSYASSFAPSKFKPTPDKPAYIVAVNKPDASMIAPQVPGTGENEIGVRGAIGKENVAGVYRGNVVSHDPGIPATPLSRGSISPSSMLHWEDITPKPESAALKLPVRPATEDVNDTMNASFVHGRDLGPNQVPIDSLKGGVALNDPAQAARVNALKAQMTGADGYLSRPIVDTDGNVIEGQHRVEALRQLGVTNVPVHVIEDLAKDVDTAGLGNAIKSAQSMHGDQRTQLMQHVLESVRDEGSPAAVRSSYDPPRGYEPGWKAALDFLDKDKPKSAGAAATPHELMSEYTPTTDLARSYQDNPLISAYHGSGADFDQFSNDHIGSGEGVQAFGHGHYLAENEGVARSYRDALSKPGLGVNGKPIADAMMEATKGAKPGDPVLDAWIMARNRVEHAYNNYGENVFGQAAKDMIKQEADERTMSAQKWRNLAADKPTNGYEASLVGQKTGRPGENEGMLSMAESQDAMAHELNKLAQHDYGIVQPGKMYEVNINANPDHFLDWDKPLNQQSDHVRNALGNSPLAGYEHTELPGAQVAPMTAQGAQAMAGYGIKGIRYLDQQSRNAGGWHLTPPSQTTSGQWMVKSSDYNSKGLHFDNEADARAALAEKVSKQTSNYVVFDPKTIAIIRKYGLAGLMAGGGAMALGGGGGQAVQ